MCLNILPPDLVWGKLAQLPRGSPKPPNTAQTQCMFKHDIVLYWWAEPRSCHTVLFMDRKSTLTCPKFRHPSVQYSAIIHSSSSVSQFNVMEPSFLIFFIHLSDIPQSIIQLEINNIFLSACQIFNFPPIKYSSSPSVQYFALSLSNILPPFSSILFCLLL